MKFVHCSVKVISRSSGRSSVAAAAYRAGDKLTNERDGKSHDYSRRSGVVHAEVMLPDGAPEAYADRSALWNSVEAVEKQKNSRLAREIEIALPNELTREEQISFVQRYAKESFVARGMCADVAIHSGHAVDDGHKANPHAHIMLTMRPVSEKGFGAKAKKVYMLDQDGNRIKTAGGSWKSYKENTTDWDRKENVFAWRADLAERINAEMERLGSLDRVDPRSYKEQGIDREPGVHLGPAATAMERRGIRTELGERNREIAERNREKEELAHQAALEADLAYEQEAAGADQQEDAGGASDAPARSAKELAEAMIEAKQAYIEGGREASAARSAQDDGRSYIEWAAAKTKEIALSIVAVEAHEARKGMLEGQRAQLGFFRFFAKRSLDRQIGAASEGLEQAKERLGMGISEAEARAEEIRQSAILARDRIKEAERDEGKAQAKREGAERAYIWLEAEARAHPDERKVREALSKDSHSQVGEELSRMHAGQNLERAADRELGRDQKRELAHDRDDWDRGR
jgi:hypothetical protein